MNRILNESQPVIIEHLQPKVYPTEQAAAGVAAFLSILEEDGWVYDVVVDPEDGTAMIFVLDADGREIGIL